MRLCDCFGVWKDVFAVGGSGVENPRWMNVFFGTTFGFGVDNSWSVVVVCRNGDAISDCTIKDKQRRFRNKIQIGKPLRSNVSHRLYFIFIWFEMHTGEKPLDYLVDLVQTSGDVRGLFLKGSLQPQCLLWEVEERAWLMDRNGGGIEVPVSVTDWWKNGGWSQLWPELRELWPDGLIPAYALWDVIFHLGIKFKRTERNHM